MPSYLSYPNGLEINNSPLNQVGRNVVDNGAMAIDQPKGRSEGSSQTFTAGAAKATAVDRWFGYCTGANVTGQRIAGSLQDRYRYQFTGAVGNTAISFGQRIDTARSYHLNGQACVLSMDLANSLLTTVTYTVSYANTTDNFGSIASPNKTQIATGNITVDSNISRYSIPISIPSAATKGIEIIFSVANQASGTWTIGDVQLELGTVATPFEREDPLLTLQKCMYRYQRSEWRFTVTRSNAILQFYPVRFSVPMASQPVATTYDFQDFDSSGATGVTPSNSNIGIGGFNVSGTVTAGSRIVATFEFSCEL